MKSQQKAFIVTAGSEKPQGLDELNIALGRGWRVAKISGMGGAGASSDDPRFAALIILEREENQSSDVLAQVEEMEDVVDDIVDGDGASKEVADDFEDKPPPSPS